MDETRRQDPELKAALQEVGQRTADGAPEFTDLWSQALSRGTSRRRRAKRLRFATVAAGLVVASLLVIWQVRERAAFREAEAAAVAMAQWRAPLDFLLQTPGQEWIATTPSLTLLSSVDTELTIPAIPDKEVVP